MLDAEEAIMSNMPFMDPRRAVPDAEMVVRGKRREEDTGTVVVPIVVAGTVDGGGSMEKETLFRVGGWGWMGLLEIGGSCKPTASSATACLG